ncbi:MMPL family transporter [Planctomicrobium sp. SH664]|uniref:MMPL family transporter n=1 Tax=Planctomicrobium sp. SH664 TaxID=3448125 RepID=UPI003F5C1D11
MVEHNQHEVSGSASGQAGFIAGTMQLLTRITCWRPWLTIGIVAVVTTVLSVISIQGLKFKTNRSDLIDPAAPYQQRWLRYTEKFGDDADVVLVVEGRGAADVAPVVQLLGEKLESQPELFERVLYQDQNTELRRKGLQYLKPADLEQAQSLLQMYGPVLSGHWERAGIESYAQRLSEYIQLCTRDNATDDLAAAIAQTQRFSASLGQFLQQPGDFQSPWPEVVSPSAFPQAQANQSNSLLVDGGRMGFVLAIVRDLSGNFSGQSAGLNRLREIVRDVQNSAPAVHIGLTGVPILEADEMAQSQSDMTMSSIVSAVGVAIILLLGLRGFRHPLIAMVMLAVGILWSLAFTYFTVGHLNILSVSFAAILIGMGIDFSVHFISHYVHQRRSGIALKPALVETAGELGLGILTAAITTTLAFLCAMFTDFLGIVELGLIAGGGVLICAVATILVLPPLLAIADKNIDGRTIPTPFAGTPLRLLIRDYPRLVTVGSLLLILAIGSQAFELRNGRVVSRVRYDYNLLNLQGEGLESVELQHRISEATNGSLLYAVSLADSPEQARLMKEKFLELPTVSRVEELASALPPFPAAETNLLVRSIHAQLGQLKPGGEETAPINPAAVGQALERLHTTLKELPEPNAQRAAGILDQVLNGLEQMPLEYQVQLLTGYQQGMKVSLQRQFEMLAEVSQPEPVGPADFPEAVRSRFISDEGDWLLRIYPVQEIWDEAPLRDFVTTLRTVDPEVTGTPVQNLEAAMQIERSYRDAACYAFVAIILILLMNTLSSGVLMFAFTAAAGAAAFAMWLIGERTDPLPVLYVAVVVSLVVALLFDRRGFLEAVLAFLPPMAGMLLLFGILSMLDIDLNPANLIVLPLILGMGVDSGVYVIHNYRTQSGRYEMSSATMNAVVLTSVTSIMGFGSMILAAHRGLVSLGLVLVVGLSCSLFISMVLLPSILSWMTRNRPPQSSPLIVDEADDELPIVPMKPAGPAKIIA